MKFAFPRTAWLVVTTAALFMFAFEFYGAGSEQKAGQMSAQQITTSSIEYASLSEGNVLAVADWDNNGSAKAHLSDRADSGIYFGSAEKDDEYSLECNNNYCRRKCGPGGGNYLGAGSCACCIVP